MLNVILPLLNYTVLWLDKLEALEKALVLFLNQIEDSECLENVQRDMAHVRVETNEAFQVRVSVEVYNFLSHINFDSGRGILIFELFWDRN